MIDFKKIRWKRVGLALLYPPVWVIILLEVVSTALLLCSMLLLGAEHALSYISYVFSAYALTTVCMRIPSMVSYFKRVKNSNRYIQMYLNDPRLRVRISLYSTFGFNTVYGFVQLVLGIVYSSIWYYSLAVYYILLAVMRFFLLRDVNLSGKNENKEREYKRARFCGIVLGAMNVTLSGIVLYMVQFGYGAKHGQIATIALAAYTFTVMALAIVNVIRFRKFKSPVFSASKVISLAAACVSMLSLEATMLYAFGTNADTEFRRIIMAATGAAICAFILTAAIYMIIDSNKNLKNLRGEHINE